MRAIWKGAVTFGLVNVPVKLYSATEDHDVPLHQVHDADGGRIRYKRVCEIDGEVVPYEHIDKAYDDGDRTVVLTKQDLADLPAERDREISVVEFVPSEQIDPIMFDRTYYLEPDSKSTKAYVLLRRTLEETDRTAVVKFALRQRTRLAALRVREEVLVLQTLLWADEIREAAFPSLDEPAKVTAKELTMSAQLVGSFEADFTPEDYEDEYQVQLRKLVDAKLEAGESVDTARRSVRRPRRRARAPRSSTSWRPSSAASPTRRSPAARRADLAPGTRPGARPGRSGGRRGAQVRRQAALARAHHVRVRPGQGRGGEGRRRTEPGRPGRHLPEQAHLRRRRRPVRHRHVRPSLQVPGDVHPRAAGHAVGRRRRLRQVEPEPQRVPERAAHPQLRPRPGCRQPVRPDDAVDRPRRQAGPPVGPGEPGVGEDRPDLSGGCGRAPDGLEDEHAHIVPSRAPWRPGTGAGDASTTGRMKR